MTHELSPDPAAYLVLLVSARWWARRSLCAFDGHRDVTVHLESWRMKVHHTR